MIRREDRELYAALAAAAAGGRRCALATVVATRGSTPRKTGTKMLVDPVAGLVGTVGGGCGEAEVLDAAREVLRSGRPARVRVDLTRDLMSWSPAVCGGVMDVLVEAVPPDPAPLVSIRYLRPPDRVEVFEQWLVHDDPDVKVTLATDLALGRTLEVDGRVALEDGSDVVWFTFPGAWHDIGRFHDASGRFTGIYANVLTPVELGAGHAWRTTDLFLDVWLPAGGGEPRILDRDELDEALEAGWIDAATGDRAEEEAETLLTWARQGEWPPGVVAAWTLERARERLAAGRAAPGGGQPSPFSTR